MAGNSFKMVLAKFVICICKLFRKEDSHTGLKDLDFESIVVFSTTALGDFLFNTPAIRSVQKRYPQARITLVSSHKNKSLVEDSPWFSDVIYWDQKVASLPSLIRQLRKSKPELAILLHSKSPYDVLCVSLSGCQYILKDSYNDKDISLRPWVAAISGPEFDGHLIERKLSLVSCLGCDKDDVSMSIPICRKNNKAKKTTEIVVAFQLGASESLRCWPIHRFQELAKLLFSSECQYRISLIGSPKEVNLADAFLADMTDDERNYITCYVGDLDLKALVEKIDEFDVLVTGDTGPLHIAVALQVPTVSLFVTANPEHTGPLQDPDLHTVIRVLPGEREVPSESVHQPMVVITAQEVMSAIEAIEFK